MQQPELVDAPALPGLPRLGRRRGLGRVALEHRDVVAVVGQQHGRRQPRHSPAGDHDRSHIAPRFDAAAARGPLRPPEATSATVPQRRLGRLGARIWDDRPRHRARDARDRRSDPCTSRSRSATSSNGPRSSTARPGGGGRRTRRGGIARRHHLRRDARPGPGHGARPRRHGRGPRRAGRHREPELGPLPHLVLRRERLRARARARQLPAQRRRGRLHRRALGRLGAARRSRARRAAGGGVGQGADGARRRARTPSSSPPHPPAPTRHAGTATRTPPARSTTPRAPRPARRACSSPTATAGSTRRSSAGTRP